MHYINLWGGGLKGNHVLIKIHAFIARLELEFSSFTSTRYVMTETSLYLNLLATN